MQIPSATPMRFECKSTCTSKVPTSFRTLTPNRTRISECSPYCFLLSRKILVLAGWFAMAVQPTTRAADWWTAFGHAGLSAAIEQGLADHPDPNAALARIRAAEAGVEIAAAGRRPMAMADAAYRVGREQSMMTGGVADDIEPLMTTARLSWEIDVFGRVGASVEAAQARAAMRTADAEAVRLALSLDIARVYIEVAWLAGDMTWLEREWVDAQVLHERAERRVQAGLDDPSTVRRAGSAVQQVEHRHMETAIRHDKARERLRSLLGGSDPAVWPDALDHFALPPVPDMTGTNLYLSRPDIVAAYQAWQAAQGESRSAAQSRLPSLALVASAAGEGDNPADPEEWSAWVGSVLTVPLWEPKRTSRARGAAADASAAEAMFESASLRAIREIATARADRQRSEAMIEHMSERERLLAAEESSLERKRTAGIVQDADLRMARMTRAAAARDASMWIQVGLRNHIDLIGALGGADGE